MKSMHPLPIEQREKTKHGEASFPVQKYLTRLTADSPVVTTHWHEEAELTLITGGRFRYQIDLADYPAGEGDLLFLSPRFLHSITREADTPCTSETYVFHLNFLGGNATDICSTRYLTPLLNQDVSLPFLVSRTHPAYPALRACFGQIQTLYAKAQTGYELALKALFLQAVFLLLPYRKEPDNMAARISSEKLKQVLDYIELHYTEPITVSQLARLCYFSDYHFMRFFRRHMGMTCVEYINNLRLEKSVELFKQGNSSILEVSLSAGYRNLSYFHRAFKKKYHMTPRAFLRGLETASADLSHPDMLQ